MSLLRLLAAGRSFDGVGDSGTGRYNMRTPNLLPKFGSGKNPFATKPKTDPVQPAPISSAKTKPAVVLATAIPAPVASIPQAQPVVQAITASAPEPIKSRAANPFAKQEPKQPVAPVNRNKTIVPTPVVRKPLTPTPSPARTREKSSAFGWAKYLNPLSYFPKREPRAPKATRQMQSRKPVQGELSLDNVKVVRNDLSDADIEVVTARPIILADTAPMAAMPIVTPTGKTATSTWGRISSRFARTEQDQTQLH